MNADGILDVVARETGRRVMARAVQVDYPERLVIEADLDDRHVMIKAADPDADTPGGNLTTEVHANDAARAAGVPVPDLVLYHAGPPTVYVNAFVSGEELRSNSPDSWWHAVGSVLRRLHEGCATGLPHFGGRDSWWEWKRSWTNYDHNRSIAERLIAPETIDRLTELLRATLVDRQQPPLTLLHGDCGPYHWLLRDRRVIAALDFGESGLGDPAFDLAALTLWDGSRLPAVLAGYGADAAFATYATELQLPYHVVRHLAAIDWLIEHDIDPRPTIQELERIATTLA